MNELHNSQKSTCNTGFNDGESSGRDGVCIAASTDGFDFACLSECCLRASASIEQRLSQKEEEERAIHQEYEASLSYRIGSKLCPNSRL